MTLKLNAEQTKALEKLKQLSTELNSIIVERTDQIEGSLAALIAGVHVLFLGPPGTAKSLLANNVCEAIDGGQFFQWLLTKFSTPEELYGPLSLKGLENDEYRRVTKNKLPEAVIAFLDEIFKSNSALLNSLLTLINERKFHNNGGATDVPLLTCFGASNELPKGEELGALYDRFILRYWVEPIREDAAFANLLNGNLGDGKPKVRITIKEINSLTAALKDIPISADLITAVREIQKELREKGINASDRRWKTSMTVLRAFALLRGNSEVTADELELLADILWAAPEDRKTIFQIVSPRANPLNLKAMEYLDDARDIYERFNQNPEDGNKAIEANAGLNQIVKLINEDMKDRPDNKIAKLLEAKEEIMNYRKTIHTKILGDVS